MKQEIEIPAGQIVTRGILSIPDKATGLVVFAHGSGSGRLSPRNNFVADELNKAGLVTLLLDLLTPDEEADRANVFDIELLSRRLKEVLAWVKKQKKIKDLPIGYFGASTGAGAALKAAAADERIKAVVSRGGRPDLALDVLPQVTAPTLLIVGGDDEPVISMNQTAYDKLQSEKQLVIVPGATHLFEEPGTLEQVASLAADWFTKYLTK